MSNKVSAITGVFDDTTGALKSISRDCGGASTGTPTPIAALSAAQQAAIDAGGSSVVVNSSGVLVDKNLSPVSGGTKTAPAYSGRLIAPGDSYAVGTGPASQSDRMTAICAGILGLTESNIAVGGVVIERIMDQQVASYAIQAGDLIPMMCGFNNVRFGGSTEANETSYITACTSVLGWLALPDAKKVFSQVDSSTLNSAQITYGGTWVASGNGRGAAATSRAGATSVVNGSYAQATLAGNTVYILISGQYGFSSKITVTIDGVTPASGVMDVSPAIAIPDTGGGVPQPVLLRFPGLSDGAHTVRITHAGTAGQYIWFGGFAAFNYNDTDLPIVVAAGPAMMTAAGYAVNGTTPPSNLGGSTATRRYQQLTERCVKVLRSDGLFVRYVDLDAAIKVSDAMIGADFVHALSLWHRIAGITLAAAAKRKTFLLV